MTDRLGLALRAAPLALVLLLALAWLAPAPSALDPSGGRGAAAARVTATLDDLPDAPVVVVGFDPDIGTYPEIRPAVRTLLGDLLEREATLVVVSLTPEGRALFVSELGRLDAVGADPEGGRIVDLGFVPGAEAALVALSRSAPVGDATPELGVQLDASGFSVADLVVVVGGNDLGPRTWVEQALPRIGAPPAIAVAPTVLLPELLPYVESGQIDGLVGTPVESAAYRAAAGDGGSAAADRPVDRLALLVGMLVALGALAQALGARFVPSLRIGRRGERA